MGKGISYRDPLSYGLATAAVAFWANEQAKAFLAGYGYTEVSDAALDTIRRNKPAELQEIRTKAREAERNRRAEIARQLIRELADRPAASHQDPR
jgi:hypothetical protein